MRRFGARVIEYDPLWPDTGNSMVESSATTECGPCRFLYIQSTVRIPSSHNLH